MAIRRGEIYSTDLIDKNTKGAEIGKIRPALVVQADIWNDQLPSTVVVPLTTKNFSYLSAGTVAFHEGEFGLTADSTTLVDQIRSIDKSRLKKKIGVVSDPKMQAVDKALSLTLGLESID